MKAGRAPVTRALRVLVLYWIKVDVIEVVLEFIFISYCMFPEATLPDATTPLGRLPRRNPAVTSTVTDVSTSKILFDDAPSGGIICIASRHRPNRMEMVRKQHHGVDEERPFSFTLSDYVTKQFAVIFVLKKGASLKCNYCEEECAARYVCAAII